MPRQTLSALVKSKKMCAADRQDRAARFACDSVLARPGAPLTEHVHCIECRYDLFGLQIECLCPECGLQIAEGFARTELVAKAVARMRCGTRVLALPALIMPVLVLSFREEVDVPGGGLLIQGLYHLAAGVACLVWATGAARASAGKILLFFGVAELAASATYTLLGLCALVGRPVVSNYVAYVGLWVSCEHVTGIAVLTVSVAAWHLRQKTYASFLATGAILLLARAWCTVLSVGAWNQGVFDMRMLVFAWLLPWGPLAAWTGALIVGELTRRSVGRWLIGPGMAEGRPAARPCSSTTT